jgi:hypothetical protein
VFRTVLVRFSLAQTGLFVRQRESTRQKYLPVQSTLQPARDSVGEYDGFLRSVGRPERVVAEGKNMREAPAERKGLNRMFLKSAGRPERVVAEGKNMREAPAERKGLNRMFLKSVGRP